MTADAYATQPAAPESGAEAARTDQQLFKRADEISSLHESLFYRIREFAELPVHIGYRNPPVLSVRELVSRLNSQEWDSETSRRIAAFLDQLYLDAEAGAFELDPEARAWVTSRPRELRQTIAKPDPLAGWFDNDDSFAGLEGYDGAKKYARERTRLEKEFVHLSAAERQKRWLEYWYVHLRNDTRSDQDVQRINQLLKKRVANKEPLTSEEEADVLRLNIDWDSASTIRRRNQLSLGPNQVLTETLARASVSQILNHPLRRKPSQSSLRQATRELQRVVNRIRVALTAEQAAKVKDVVLTSGPVPATIDDHPFHHMWLKAQVDGTKQTIIASAPTMLLAFSVCSARSYAISAWNFRGLLAGKNVREASDTPYDIVSQMKWPRASRQTPLETAFAAARIEIHAEPDSDENRLLFTKLLAGVDNPMPRFDDVRDARRVSWAHVDGFGDCAMRYFGFAAAHELAHLYLSTTPGRLMLDERKADCEAVRVLREVQKGSPFTSGSVDGGGFIAQLLAEMAVLEDAISPTSRLAASLAERRKSFVSLSC